jgi:hypothetical protein
VTFRFVFLYAVLRGVLDALLGRPDLQGRLMRVLLARQFRAMLPAIREISKAFVGISKEFTRTATRLRTVERLGGSNG